MALTSAPRTELAVPPGAGLGPSCTPTAADLNATLGDPLLHYELNAEPGHYSIRGAPAGLSLVTVVYAVGTADGWHLAADHHELVAYGTELLVLVAFIFVGSKLVARRLFE
jgi:hypothetical protein